MKNTYCIIASTTFIVSSLFASTAQAQNSKEKLCRTIGASAISVMAKRQNGLPKSEVRMSAEKTKDINPFAVKIYDDMVNIAYSVPIKPENKKENYSVAFGKIYYDTCMNEKI